MHENRVLKAKCDKLIDEHLSIPRLEEKMQRETREQLFSMNQLMRKKEKHWSKYGMVDVICTNAGSCVISTMFSFL